MLFARAATKEDKEKKDGGVATGPPKKKKNNEQWQLTTSIGLYTTIWLKRANANGMLQPQPPREPPPPYLIKASRSTTGQ